MPPQNIQFSETPKIIEIQKLQPKQMTRAYACNIRVPPWGYSIFVFSTLFMRGSRNFRQVGGGGVIQVNLTKKALTFFVFCFVFLVLSLCLFYRSQIVNFKEIYHFSRFQRGSNIFQGGGGGAGSNCLFPIETHITCDFPGGGVRTPCPPPSGSALAFLHKNDPQTFWPQPID